MKKFILFLLSTVLFCAFINYVEPFGFGLNALIYAVKSNIYWALLGIFRNIFLDPIFYAGVGAILILEVLFPAKKAQKILSVSFMQDMVWFIATMWLKVTFIYVYVEIIRNFYAAHLSFLTIQPLAKLPFWFIFPLSVLFSDFLAWFNHFIRHKVPIFWCFHTIHHSQEHLNLFTDMRYHVVEYIIDKTLSIVPLLMLGIEPSVIVIYNLFYTWFTRTYHGNIKSNYGFFKYIFVTPQSHRVHHSNDPKHFDKNFGVLFSIWDYLFKTQYTNYDEYPDTGIPDKDFPVEKSFNPVSLILMPIIQHIYPFRVIIKDIAKRFKKNMK